MPRKNPYYVAYTKSEAKEMAAQYRRIGYSKVSVRKGPGGEEYYVNANPPRKRNTVSLASLSRGIKAKWVKIRKVKNGIRVTIKK